MLCFLFEKYKQLKPYFVINLGNQSLQLMQYQKVTKGRWNEGADQIQRREAKNDFEVNLGEDWSVHFWSNQFNCSPDTLRNVAHEVGVSSMAIRERLKNMKAEIL